MKSHIISAAVGGDQNKAKQQVNICTYTTMNTNVDQPVLKEMIAG